MQCIYPANNLWLRILTCTILVLTRFCMSSFYDDEPFPVEQRCRRGARWLEYGGFHGHGGAQLWTKMIVENPIQMDDLGVPPFQAISRCLPKHTKTKLWLDIESILQQHRQFSSPRSSPFLHFWSPKTRRLPTGCLAVHRRCLGKKVRARVGAEIPTRLADPMPIFNPRKSRRHGDEARIPMGSNPNGLAIRVPLLQVTSADIACNLHSTKRSLTVKHTHIHKKKDSSHQIKFLQIMISMRFALICWQEAWPNRPWKVLPHVGSLCLWRDVWSSSSSRSSDGWWWISGFRRTLSSHPTTRWCSYHSDASELVILVNI